MIDKFANLSGGCEYFIFAIAIVFTNPFISYEMLFERAILLESVMRKNFLCNA